ncbi:endonuclease toxin domain-containing protein [Capnocytophaga felis]|uniref:CdiA toxin EC869-like domain-containing protein n=1 Tax=Capnocytophaga felis TaxID=2267611 RepID=A0A5M4BAF5_9FLAO|nr:hypothetical protein [Capnocytophaga felis]GET46197.1 hypothetical protein RCZ01_14990 [Capnocytophaga felis]GET48988.1 hypothetical protein RCZ02_18190 [Capnocytophaga felis]
MITSEELRKISEDVKTILALSEEVIQTIEKAIKQGFLSKEEYETLKDKNRKNTEQSKAILAEMKLQNVLTEAEYAEKIQELNENQSCLENSDCIKQSKSTAFVNKRQTTGYGMSFEKQALFVLDDDCIEKLKKCMHSIEKNDNDIAVQYLSNEKELKDSIPAYYMNNRGFWINGKENFGEYVGNVTPSTDRYYELVEIEGVLYHKNTNAIHKKAINTVFGTTWIEKKEYDTSEETFNDVIKMGAEFAILGMVINKLSGVAAELFKNAGNSLWKVAPLERGFVYEKMLNLKGAFNFHNYPVIDAFYQGVATSVKTLNLNDKSYQVGNAIFNTLKGYINKLANFKGVNRGGVNTINQINTKVLEVGIPRGATAEQIKQINKAIQYAQQQGVKMNIRVIK